MSLESAGPLKEEVFQFLEEGQKQPVEDRRLRNWTVWLKRRKKQYDKLCPALNRTPECLAMNYEKNPNEYLDKCLIEEAQVFTYEDKYRGSPLFWKTVKPTKEGRKNGIETLVYAANEKFHDDPEKFYNRGYTDIPGGILEEKCEKPCLTKIRRPWVDEKNLKKRKEELASKLNLLEPFRPDLKELMIKGVGYKTPRHESEYSVLKPTIEYDLICDKNESLETTNVINPPIIKIGTTTISQQVCAEDLLDEYNWFLTFTNKTVYDIHTQTVIFENKGTTAVHYRWEEMPTPSKNLPIKYSRFRMPRFFFDTSPGVMVPGQHFTIEFIFRSTTPGNFRQVWQLKTIPMVRSAPILFILQAVAVENAAVDVGKTWEEIEIYIRKCVKESLVRQILDDVDFGVKTPTFATKYFGLFLEKEIFETINPDLNYKPDSFNALKELRSKVSKDKWDLSMLSIRTDIIRKEKDCELRHEYLGELNSIVGELKAPPNEGQLENVKYETAYTIMSTFINQMSKTALILQDKFKLKPIPRIKTLAPKFELSRSLEDLRTIKILEESSEDEEFLKDFSEGMGTPVKGKGGAQSVAAGKKRMSTARRASSKKRMSTARRASSKKRMSTARRASSKKRMSTARRASNKGGGQRKSMKGGGGAGGAKQADKDSPKKAPTVVKPAFIKLTSEKEIVTEKRTWEPEPNRDIYKCLLTAHVRDFLGDAIDKLCTVVDSLNSYSPEEQTPKYIAFPDDGPKEVIIPEKPQIQKDYEKEILENSLLNNLLRLSIT